MCELKRLKTMSRCFYDTDIISDSFMEPESGTIRKESSVTIVSCIPISELLAAQSSPEIEVVLSRSVAKKVVTSKPAATKVVPHVHSPDDII